MKEVRVVSFTVRRGIFKIVRRVNGRVVFEFATNNVIAASNVYWESIEWKRGGKEG